MGLQLGKGLAFPFTTPPHYREGIEHLKQSIFLILATKKGERVMRPWFGSNLHDYVDAPINKKTLAQIRYAVWEALREEPRVKLRRVKIDSPQPHILLITVLFEIHKGVEEAVSIAFERDLRRWKLWE